MEEINRSETTTNRNWNEWVDSEGRLHRKVITETIITPSIKQHPNFPDFRFVKFNLHPGLWNPMSMPMNMPDPMNFFGNNMPKPLLSKESIQSFIETGKKFLKESGIKIEDLFKSEEKPEFKEDVKTESKDLKTEETVKSKEVKKDAKSKKTSKKSQESQRR